MPRRGRRNRRSFRITALALSATALAGLGAALVPVVASQAPSAPVSPGPHDLQQALADGRRAGSQQSSASGSRRSASPATAAATAAAPGSGATVGGFVSFHVYATQFAPNTQGSVEVAVPDQCVKFVVLGWTKPFSDAHCSPSGYPSSGDYRVFVSSDDTGKNAFIPVKDVGPWNIDDNYWDPAGGGYPRPRRLFTDLPQGTPESQAAFYNGYNTVQGCKDLSGNPTTRTAGADQRGRCVLNPSAIDLSFAAASQLGMSGSGWVTVTYMWEPLVPGYVVDLYGGVHGYSGAPPVPGTGYWWGQDVARGIATRPDKRSGYVLDKSGGVWSFGNAPGVQVTGYWSGQDVTRGIGLDPTDSSGTKGYTLDWYGGIHPFGGAAPVQGSAPYWPGRDVARGIVVSGPGKGYVLDSWGGVHAFGGAPDVGITGYWPGKDVARGIALSGPSQGYVVDDWGGIHPFGGAPNVPGTSYWPNRDAARGITYVNSLHGGYVLDLYGGVHAFGTAPAASGGPYWYGRNVARGISG
ncbi:MAG: hypothetical protein JWP02_1237 [Acidimicrobiales bacterium]|nr:hypothetical protein [Acidimicrobiales bacterium]